MKGQCPFNNYFPLVIGIYIHIMERKIRLLPSSINAILWHTPRAKRGDFE